MNNICKVVWSHVHQQFVVASEIASSIGKAKSTRSSSANTSLGEVVISSFNLQFRQLSLAVACVMLAPAAWAQSAGALPAGGQVVAGQGGIQTQGAVMTVNQTSQRMALDWQSFNIGAGQKVIFVQPNAQAAALNRVLGSDVSTIQGQINANGRVYLLNPNGILFTPSVQVNVGGMVASTLGMTNADFMAGNDRLAGDSMQAVINRGQIRTAQGGTVALVAAKLTNAGDISAPSGSVLMAAGRKVRLDLGAPAQIEVEEGALNALIEQTGSIRAADGMVYLTAKAASQLSGSAINHSGLMEAGSIDGKGGLVVLEADHIHLSGSSRIEVTGANGGGEVLVGGDWQGSGGLRQAITVTMDAGSMIDASATDHGNGGKVVLWSDVINAQSVTTASGAIYAKGGAQGGDGGQIETSGAKLVTDGVTGSAAAPKGQAGEWLFDPYNIEIVASSGDINGSFASGTWTATGDSSKILSSTIEGLLNGASGGTSVTITTAGAGTQVGNITVSSALTANANSTASLTLIANEKITVNQAITSGGALSLTGASIDVHANIESRGGNVLLDADSGSQLSFAGNGVTIAAGKEVNALNGSLTINGRGGNVGSLQRGVFLDSGAKLTTGSGPITITGFGGDGDGITNDQNHGVQLGVAANLSAVAITTAGGDIVITGAPSTTVNATNRDGISVQRINAAAGTGSITLDGGIQHNSVSSESIAFDGPAVFGHATNQSGPINFIGDLFWINPSNVVARTSGQVVFESKSASFFQGFTFNQITLNTDTSQLRIGKPGNATNVTFASTVNIAGPVKVYGGDIAINNSVTTTQASGGGILLKGAGNITVGANLITNGSDITLWSDSDASGRGGINIKNNVTLDSRTSADRAANTNTSNGGKITLAGGLDDAGGASGADQLRATGMSAGDGIPDGYAANYLASGSVNYGIGLGTITPSLGHDSNVNIYSGGGNIRIHGRISENSPGGAGYWPTAVLAHAGYDINSGNTGDITMLGAVTSAGLSTGAIGFDMQAWRESHPASQVLTSPIVAKDGNINIIGRVDTTTQGSLGVAFDGDSQNGKAVRALIATTGTGTVTLDGAVDSSNAAATDLRLTSVDVLAAQGDINLVGAGKGFTVSDYRGDGLVLGSKVGTIVTSSTSDVLVHADKVNINKPFVINTTGHVTVQPNGTSFASPLAWGTNITLGNTVSALTLGKAGNAAAINVNAANAALTVNGPISVYSSGGVTQTGQIVATSLALYGNNGAGNFTLQHANNNVSTLAASSVGNLSYWDSGALTIGTVGSTHGVSAAGTVDVQTLTGDLTVAKDVSTTNATSNALLLNAGKSASAGTAAGGDLIMMGSPTISVGTGGTGKLYSGGVSSSTGLTALVGSGTGHFRYNSDETTSNYTTALSSGLNAIYREQPAAAINGGSVQSMTYGDALPAFSASGMLNGDTTNSTVGIANRVDSSSGNIKAGSYTYTAADLIGLGYSLSGSLTVTPKTITSIAGITAAHKTYDGGTSASLTTSGASFSGMLTSDALTVASSVGTFNNQNAGTGKTVSITGLSLGGADAANYTLASTTASTTANITKKDVMLGSVTASNKSYDGTTVASISSGSISGTVGSETLVIRGVGSFDTKNVGTGKTVTVSDVTALTKTDGTGAWDNYNLTTTGGMNTAANITKKDVTLDSITAANKTYDGNTTASISAGSISGTVGSETLAISGAGSFDTQNAGEGKTVTVGDVTTLSKMNGTGDWSNYNLTTTGSKTTTAAIAKRALALAIDSEYKRSGDPDPTWNYQILSGALLNTDALTLSRLVGEAPGRYLISASNPNYQISAADAYLNIANRIETATVVNGLLTVAPVQAASQATSSPVLATPLVSASVSTLPASASPSAQISSGLMMIPVAADQVRAMEVATTPSAQQTEGAGQPAAAGWLQSVQSLGYTGVLVVEGGVRLPEGVR